MANPTSVDTLTPGRRRRREYRKGFTVFIGFGLLATLGNAILGDGVIPPFLLGPLSPVVALGLAAGFVVAIGLLAWLASGLLDEHEVDAIAFGQEWAWAIVAIGYPVWYLLWRGDLAREPSHVAMFVTLLLVSWAGYVYRKFVQ